MSSPGTLAIAALLVLALTGCSTHGSDDSDGRVSPNSPTGESHAPEPDLTPLSEASSANVAPSPLHDTPSLGRAEDAAKAGHSRLDAEQFALETAHLIMDVRGDSNAQGTIESLSSDDLDPQVKQFLIQDIKDQRQIGTQRHYDIGIDMWIRSQVVGPASAPDRVNAEVAGILVAKPAQVSAWYRTRLDVAWQDDRWQLIGYSSGNYGPDTSANLTEAERADYLEGPGWRRLKAG